MNVGNRTATCECLHAFIVAVAVGANVHEFTPSHDANNGGCSDAPMLRYSKLMLSGGHLSHLRLCASHSRRRSDDLPLIAITRTLRWRAKDCCSFSAFSLCVPSNRRHKRLRSFSITKSLCAGRRSTLPPAARHRSDACHPGVFIAFVSGTQTQRLHCARRFVIAFAAPHTETLSCRANASCCVRVCFELQLWHLVGKPSGVSVL